VTAAAIILSACVASLFGHHSISAEFDLEKRVTVAGIVTRVEWMNPHTYFYLDAPNPKTRKVENWAFQLNNPKALRVLGWNQDSLKVGDVITASGSPSLSGSKAVYTREIRFENGRKFNAEYPASATTPQ
jgi:hypothetical protein